MVRKLQKIGNSHGITIPKSILEKARISEDTEIELRLNKGKIEIVPVMRIRPLRLEGIWGKRSVSLKDLTEARRKGLDMDRMKKFS